jgi:mRNA interferase MazF
MTIYERGDVVLVPFPFSDQSASKKRPAVIISSDRYNKLSSDVVIMAITSKTHKADGPVEYVIEDWEKTGLLKPSLIKPAVSTIEQKLIIKKLGSFSSKDINLLGKALKELFGLKP